jgi:Tfp pilus assembly protein PilF
MLRSLSIVLLLNLLFCNVAYGDDYTDHGTTGTLNTDYFNPTNDDFITWRIKDIEVHHLRPAVGHLRDGDYKRAFADLDFILVRFVNHPQALSMMGLVAKWTKNSILVVPYYERALGLYPEYALTNAQYGKYLIDINHVEKGIAKLKRALEIDPKLVVAYEWLAAAYVKIGDSDLARKVAEQARSLGHSEKSR